MEALANQMHGLEDEARLSVQGVLPSLHVAPSHAGPSASMEVVATAPTILKENETKSKRSDSSGDVCDGNTVGVLRGDYVGGYESDEDEEKFFDAPEISPEDWRKAKDTEQISPQDTTPSVGHRRSFSTTSVNDASSMQSTSDADVKEKLPQVSSDRRMAVSGQLCCDTNM